MPFGISYAKATAIEESYGDRGNFRQTKRERRFVEVLSFGSDKERLRIPIAIGSISLRLRTDRVR
jgi:hypothetical protein